MNSFNATDWEEARHIEQIYKKVSAEKKISASDFIKNSRDLPISNGVRLFLVASNGRISVDWLKRRHSTAIYQAFDILEGLCEQLG
jgi:hypothetical protein